MQSKRALARTRQIAERMAEEAALTPQETKVWLLFAVEDQQRAAIAGTLGLAYSTVCAHLDSAKQKVWAWQKEAEAARRDRELPHEEWLLYEAIPNLSRTASPHMEHELTDMVRTRAGALVPIGRAVALRHGTAIAPDDLWAPGHWRKVQAEIDRLIAEKGRPGDRPKPKKSRRERRAEKRGVQAQT